MLSWYWQFISWNIEDKRYYVGNLTDITSYKRESEITLNLMKKYNVRGKNLYFIYPLRAYIVVVDDLPVSKCLWTLSHPEAWHHCNLSYQTVQPNSIDFWYRLISDASLNSHQEMKMKNKHLFQRSASQMFRSS